MSLCDTQLLLLPGKILMQYILFFIEDSRNVRLGLASDGFNLFRNISTYCVQSVILVAYNFPPWLCMKDPYFMMSLLIPSTKAPGNNIDIYIETLIGNLKCLKDTVV